MIKFIKSLITVAGGTIFLNMSNFVCLLIATRHLTKEEIGIYFLVIVSIGVASSITCFGMRPSIVKFLTEEFASEATHKLISSTTTFLLLTISLASITALLIDEYVVHLGKPTAFVLLFVSISLFDHFNVLLQGLKHFRRLALVNAFNGILKGLCVALFLMYFRLGSDGFYLALILTNFGSVCLQGILLRDQLKGYEVLHIHRKTLLPILKFSLPLYANDLYSNLYDRGYTFLIGALLSPVAVAHYNIAARIPSFLDHLRNTYSLVFFPTIVNLVKTNVDDARILIRVSCTLPLLAICPVSLLFFAFRTEIVAFIFTENYVEASMAVLIMLLRSPLRFSGPIMGNTLVALGKNRAPFQINVLVTSLTFLCSYFIIPRLGYMGVVYIAFAGSIFAFILNYVYLCNAGIRSGVGLHYFVIFACFTGLLVAVQTSRDILFVISVSVLFLSYAHLLVSFLRCVKHRLGGGLMEWRRNGRLPSALT